ncbi:MAG: lysine exporter LysO family protein [Bacillota bacterium]
MVQIPLALGLGLLLGRKRSGIVGFDKLVRAGSQAGLFVLLLCVGVQLGQPRIVVELGLIGVRALATCLGACGLSLASVGVLESWMVRRGIWPARGMSLVQEGRDYTPLVVWSAFLIGIEFSGVARDVYAKGYITEATTWTLCWLVFLAGMDIARSGAWSTVREMGLAVLFVPGAIGAASIIGAMVGGIITGMDPGEAMAVGAGFGWYSFSGVLLTNARGVELGAVAFSANLLRELITFTVAGSVRRKRIRLASVALGGATAMDSTLPMIVRCDGPEVAVIGFISGVSLTLLAPLVIPAILKMFLPQH